MKFVYTIQPESLQTPVLFYTRECSLRANTTSTGLRSPLQPSLMLVLFKEHPRYSASRKYEYLHVYKQRSPRIEVNSCILNFDLARVYF